MSLCENFSYQSVLDNLPTDMSLSAHPQRNGMSPAALVRLIPMNVTVEEIKQDPEAIIHRVTEGETLVVTEHDRPIAEIRPIEMVRKPRPFGLAKGEFVVPDDFDAPLPDDVLKAFE